LRGNFDEIETGFFRFAQRLDGRDDTDLLAIGPD